MSNWRDNVELPFFERKPSSRRMAERDNAGKSVKKTKKKHYEEHFNKNWDKDLWDQIGLHCLSGSMGY